MGSVEELQRLTETERAWVLRSEAVWREAHAIAAANPGVDPGDVYHALRCLGFPSAERLRRGLTRVRLRPHRGSGRLVRGVRVKVLPLERVIVSKRAARRPKDQAQMPMLEAALAVQRARQKRD